MMIDDCDAQNSMAVVMRIRPHLPDDIIRQILSHLPTKSAIRMSILSKQFEGAWCSLPVIDLDEGKPQANLDRGIHFTNILKRYLKFRTENKDRLHPPLDKFRLRMAVMYPDREDILEKLLTSFAQERSVKELDLSCLIFTNIALEKRPQSSLQILVNINSLTSLSLESVGIENDVTRSGDIVLLPSLKTVSLESIHLQSSFKFLSHLISRCPAIEYLTLTSCTEFFWFGRSESITIARSRTLKHLEIRDCSFSIFHVSDCEVLESVTLVSKSPRVILALYGGRNLKYINICSEKATDIGRCKDSVEATMDTPNLQLFRFNGFDAMKCMNGRHLLSNFVISTEMLAS
ncbi:F-box/FBD/LRR-repeat protein At2g26030-like [Rosa rugosa]|uniref:F-box/FBD/LRR-repeat protein At2g26030-like n=1 Tax=Rosa rugosa TaxID=74645 RepID=UPI002B407E30|nr:F-box/FBD/LRR-repeat protein At2g26030-like [Rosa rugosa]